MTYSSMKGAERTFGIVGPLPHLESLHLLEFQGELASIALAEQQALGEIRSVLWGAGSHVVTLSHERKG